MNALETVIQIVSEESGCEELSESTRFDELGIDSLDFLVIVQRVRNEVAPISDESAQRIETVGQLVEAATRAN